MAERGVRLLIMLCAIFRPIRLDITFLHCFSTFLFLSTNRLIFFLPRTIDEVSRAPRVVSPLTLYLCNVDEVLQAGNRKE